uniref:Dissimilatory sulfite reductase beta subunit n=1 Tax=Macrostomum lignano TaxID=282301 RepID=A0A1I8G313_9PLAT
ALSITLRTNSASWPSVSEFVRPTRCSPGVGRGPPLATAALKSQPTATAASSSWSRCCEPFPTAIPMPPAPKSAGCSAKAWLPSPAPATTGAPEPPTPSCTRRRRCTPCRTCSSRPACGTRRLGTTSPSTRTRPIRAWVRPCSTLSITRSESTRQMSLDWRLSTRKKR